MACKRKPNVIVLVCFLSTGGSGDAGQKTHSSRVPGRDAYHRRSSAILPQAWNHWAGAGQGGGRGRREPSRWAFLGEGVFGWGDGGEGKGRKETVQRLKRRCSRYFLAYAAHVRCRGCVQCECGSFRGSGPLMTTGDSYAPFPVCGRL